jgi:hypothetical protein
LKVTTLWNEEVKAVRNIPKNKPDIIIRDKEICTLLDAAFSGDTNAKKEGAERILR